MFRRIHGNKIAGDKTLALLCAAVGQAEGNTRLGREQLVVFVHIHDVVEASHRPDPAIFLIFVQMDRVFGAQAGEIVPVQILLKQVSIGDVQFRQWQAVGVWQAWDSGNGFAHVYVSICIQAKWW